MHTQHTFEWCAGLVVLVDDEYDLDDESLDNE